MIPIESKITRPDWATIETDYITGKIGTHRLAKKYGVPYTTLRYHCEREGWTKKREEHRRKLVEKSAQKTADIAASNAAKLEKAKGLLLDIALGVLEKYPRNAGNKLRTFGTDSKGNQIMTEFELAAVASVLEKLSNGDAGGPADNELLRSLMELERRAAGNGD